jgi:hypothetical protein
VGFWADEAGGAAVKALEATAEADAYVTSLKEAARFCINAARGQVRSEAPPENAPVAKDEKAPAPQSKKAKGAPAPPARVA